MKPLARISAALLALTLLLAVGGSPVAAATADSKLVDLTFLHKLQNNQVPFTAQPLAVAGPVRDLAMYPDLADQPYISAGAQAILDKLLAAHMGAKPGRVAFLISTAEGFNCTTLPTGEIACTYGVLDMLLPTSEGQTQLAFLLAHELGHRLIAGQGERFAKADKLKSGWMQTGMLAAVALDIALSKRVQTGNTLTITATPAATSALWNSYFGGVYMGQTASGLASLNWSQKEEDEADQFGVYLMQQAGYDITQSQQLFANLDTLVRTKHLKHESVARQVAEKAAQAAALQALGNGRGGWIGILGAGVMGGFSASEEVAADHYHRDFGDRKRRCGVIIDALQPDPPDDQQKDELAAINRQLAGAGGPTLATAGPPKETSPAPAKPPAPTAKTRLARNSRGKPAPTAAHAPAPPPPTPWELAQRSLGGLQEIELSDRVIQVLASKGDKDALSLCPDRPSTAQLAFSCGLAFAGDSQNDKANALFRTALADPYAGPKMYHNIALTQAQMKDERAAMATLDKADLRFPDAPFYIDRLSVALSTGDLTGAKAAADQCENSKADQKTKFTCRSMISQVKT